MGLPLVINGTSYLYPETGDTNWGSQATLWSSAVTIGMLQRAGGAFTLTSDVDFGPNFGLFSIYYKSRSSNIATAGNVRLAVTDSINWRNNANSADLGLAINGSDQLTFNGSVIKAGLIVNADISASAAIAFSKMAALSNSVAVVTNGSGVVTTSATTATQIGYLSTTTSDVQTQITARLPLAGGTMTGFLTLNADPVSSLQAVTKQYVDAVATGINAKTAVRVATTTNGTLATAFANGQTVDGVTLATNDRILIKNQTSAPDNGIYVVQASGAPVRSTDANSWPLLVGAFVFVSAGTANTATSWVCNVAAGGTIGVTAVTFVQFGAAGTYTADGNALILTGSQFSVQLNGSTLSQSGSGLKVAAGGITNTEVAANAAITLTKLAALSSHSRALASDSSGFIVESSVTSTELGYVSGVTSAIQTQIAAQIPKSILTTTNDMLYATGANTPARLAAGTDTYYLRSSSGVPTWTAPQTSYTFLNNSVTPLSIPTSFTSIPLGSATFTVGSALTLSSNSISFPFGNSGNWEITVMLSNVNSMTNRNVTARVQDTTSTSVLGTGKSFTATSSGVGMIWVIPITLSNASHTHEVQVCASGSGATASVVTIGGTSAGVWSIIIKYIGNV